MAILERSLGSDAAFRPHQWETIDALVNDHARLLVVQRTGWGKSTMYFIATRLLRDCGAGPTLIVSPLLALMRNQVADAEAELGLRAETINSSNTAEWAEIRESVRDGEVDVLLISPERLSNEGFQRRILSNIVDELGLLVIDEAHCISNWGHDFRPDYRRLSDVVGRLPNDVPVAATTATANDRVVEDVTDQLPDIEPVRGDLVRESLRLHTVAVDSRAERLAWLADEVPRMQGSGIVYCLTTDETENVAGWLAEQGNEVLPYHGGMDSEIRREREDQLMADEVTALVATNAHGMGFNKPDLAWVVHYQRPPNLIRYYQEIGRAGRALDEAKVILLSGEEDDAIAEYFIDQAFPSPTEFEAVLATITDSDEPLYKYQLLRRLDVSYQTVSSCLNILSVEGAITKADDGFVRTDQAWAYDHERVEEVTAHRWAELERIQEFVTTDRCLMRFVDDELDGQLEQSCGRCANCSEPVVSPAVEDGAVVEEAIGYYRSEGWREIPERFHDLFERRSFAHFATLNPDGTLHVTTVWDDFDGSHIVVNTADDRRKDKNVRRNPNVGLLIPDPDNPYRNISIQGTVTERTKEGAVEHIDKLAREYMDGVDEYPYDEGDAQRVILRIRSDNCVTYETDDERLLAPVGASTE